MSPHGNPIAQDGGEGGVCGTEWGRGLFAVKDGEGGWRGRGDMFELSRLSALLGGLTGGELLGY